MPATYEPIATTTLGSAASTVTFSSIPNTYTDLILIINAKTSASKDVAVRFNSDTTANCSYTYLAGFGSSTQSSRGTGNSYVNIDGGVNTSTTDGYNAVIHINNYSNSTTFKSVLARSNNVNTGTSATVGLWRNTAAINTILVTGFSTANFSIGSTFSLYGIKAA